MNKLNVAIVQENLIWENPIANQKLFTKHFESLENVDLVILPEMFTTGFTMNTTKLAQPINGAAIQWVKEKSLDYNFSIIGSLMITQNENVYNRCVMSYPCSDVKWYDKRHLFRMGNEHEVFTPGERMVIFKYFGWRIRPLICYDLRFPVWSRNNKNYDLLVYVANWPAARNEAWETLLKARAIENQCYVIGVNRVGTDGNGIEYAGNSLVVNYKGEIITQHDNSPGVSITTIDLAELQIFREKFPVHIDADSFEIKA